MKYDVIIIGAGPCGIFTALQLKKNNPSSSILILEKGNTIKKRICPKRKTGICIGCKPCNITTGFAGAGAYSDENSPSHLMLEEIYQNFLAMMRHKS